MVGFIVAGFPNESDPPELFEVAVEADTTEKRYIYPPPGKLDFRVLPMRYITGHSDRAYAAIDGVEPERSTLLCLFTGCIPK